MKTLLFVFAACISLSFTLVDKPFQLQYHFKVGDHYEWGQVTTQKIVQSVTGTSTEINTTIEGTMQLVVKELTPTGAKLDFDYKRIVSKTLTSMGNLEMDSDSEEDTPGNKTIKALIGKTITIFMSKNGKIEKIENIENLWSGISSLDLDEASKAVMQQSLEKSFGESSLRASLEMALAYYPNNKVSQGDSWKDIGHAALNFPIEIENTWKLFSLDASKANVNAEGVVRTIDKDKIIELPGGMQSKFDLNGTQSVKSIVDVRSGWPSELKISSVIKGNMLLLAGGPISSDMDIPMEIFSESTFTFVKK